MSCYHIFWLANHFLLPMPFRPLRH
jgi:hypothetical protein